MPRKISDKTNGRLHFTLPKGARALLDELVELQEVGGSHAEVIRYLIETQLQIFRRERGLGKKREE